MLYLNVCISNVRMPLEYSSTGLNNHATLNSFDRDMEKLNGFHERGRLRQR